ncbi:MAG: valine--tRNA ligase [Candidatus Parcubacteria bacterium]|jgi:valyl-tRNA synthetase
MFSKKYDHHDEQKTYQYWLQNDCFKPIKNDDPEKKFIIPIPPPNVTGVLHIGHAMMLAVQDTMVRYHRMQGFETLWVPGTDHAGISTQSVVEKNLKKESGKKKEDIGREVFMKKLWEWVHNSRSTINDQFQRMGSSVDRSKEQFTMSEQLSRGVRKAFKKLYDQGKIYQSQYMVNRSPGAQTVVSDMEVEYKEEKTSLYHIRYFVEGKGDSILVATIRPETMFADVAVAVHPKDKRYKKWIGKNVLIPLINKPIPVIADERVLMDF